MRINQFVANATGMSRRAADTAISDDRVTIDGRPAVLGDTPAETSDIRLDGQKLALTATHSYVMLNKPAGYVSSRARQSQDPTLYELLPEEFRALRIAGRLDRDSSGLILLSDDGSFVHHQTHPSFEKRKVYELTLSHDLSAADRRHLETGVVLTDGPSRLKVISVGGPRVVVSLGEGRNRQLRRTFGALGYTVKRLHRTQMGPYILGDLVPGKWQNIAPEDRA